MKVSSNIKNTVIEVICLLYILLFVYAGMNKGLDFENFEAELGQSPLLSAYAQWISWFVIMMEFAIAVLLLFPKTRIKALYAAFCLMSMFTAYIFIMLNYSSFLPCSCGGILEKMSWQQHLVFNAVFVWLAAVALWLYHSQKLVKSKIIKFVSYPVQLFLIFLCSSVVVLIMFLSSEEIMQHQNPFIRRYPHHPVTLQHTIDLEYNSYYFAGSGSDKLYLGNSTVPLYILSIDKKLEQQKIRVGFNRRSFAFQSSRLVVKPPFFYILDGRVPAIFTGTTKNWKAVLQEPAPPYFSIAVPLDTTTIVFRGISKTTSTNTLGIFRSGAQSKIQMAPQLLQKQIDGVFDTDGMLHYSPELRRIIYLYSYRNQYIVADQNTALDYRANTIDTVANARIKIAYLKNGKEQTMAIPTLTVNKSSSVYRHLLFVNSNVPGRYEQKEVWKQASVIDVYDLTKKTYIFSFHIYRINGVKLRSFLVTNTHLYALIDSKLVIYQLSEKLKNEMERVADTAI